MNTTPERVTTRSTIGRSRMETGPAPARPTRDPTFEGQPVCVVGCGRTHRRDDQIGLRVAETLAGNPPPGTTTRTSEDPRVDLITDLEGVELLVAIDTSRTTRGVPAGRVKRTDYLESAASAAGRHPGLAETRQAGPSPGLGVADALKLARELKSLPAHVWVYTVTGQDFGYGTRLSPSAQAAVRAAAERIRSDIAAWLRQRKDSDA